MAKKKFTISDEQFEKINDYWKELGNEMGFYWDTIEPIDNRNFYAEIK